MVIIATVAAMTLIWLGIEVFRGDPPSSRTASESASRAASQSRVRPSTQTHTTPLISEEAPKPAATAKRESPDVVSEEPRSTSSTSAAAEQQALTDASPWPINEVLPDPPQSALDTIRGTVRVTIRMVVDKEGRVVTATSHDPGPSRYFERLALEAAKKWTFAPADTQAQRVVLVKFHFRNEGTTAQVQAPE